MCTNHQLRHQATRKAGCKPGNCGWPLDCPSSFMCACLTIVPRSVSSGSNSSPAPYRIRNTMWSMIHRKLEKIYSNIFCNALLIKFWQACPELVTSCLGHDISYHTTQYMCFICCISYRQILLMMESSRQYNWQLAVHLVRKPTTKVVRYIKFSSFQYRIETPLSGYSVSPHRFCVWRVAPLLGSCDWGHYSAWYSITSAARSVTRNFFFSYG